MKYLFALLICLSTRAHSQANPAVVTYFQSQPTMSFTKAFFFEQELIEFCTDSSNRMKIIKEVARQRGWINDDGVESAQERKIFLQMLYQRIQNIDVRGTQQIDNKTFLLRQLSQFKTDFIINEKLLAARLDPKKRGMPFGDEECDAEFSFFVFFMYDPHMLVITLKKKELGGSERIVFPTNCFLEALNYTPLVMKKRTQSELLKRLDGFVGTEYDELRKQIRTADLNAKLD